MGYSSGLLEDRVTVLNRKEADTNRFGLDAAGIEWESYGIVDADVTWSKGKRAMNVGAIDAYAYILVRMRWHGIINMRSRIVYNDQQYAIIPETYHADYRDNTIQFNAQLLVNETPAIGPTHGSDYSMDYNSDY